MIKGAFVFALVIAVTMGHSRGSAEPIVDPMRSIRDFCHYDISLPKDASFSSVSVESTANAYKTYKVKFQLLARGKALTGSVTFNCLEHPEIGRGAQTSSQPVAAQQPSIEEVLGPKALIENEDAGGRYARVVAWQRPLPSTQWSADVAYVNAVFGDGQRSSLNFFLVCNRTIASPCIEVTFDQHAPLSSLQQQSVLEFLGRIAPAAK